VADAHQYLLDHFKEFDFIWSSPPCPSHSRLGKLRALSDSKITGAYKYNPKYPDMNLYQEILLLKHYFEGKWCVENVISYYKPLIRPTEIQRHYFWSNFFIGHRDLNGDNIEDGTREEWEKRLDMNISKYKMSERKDTILRNCVNPHLGLHILNESKRDIQPELFRQSKRL